jgi:hypothetical protein
LARSFERRTIYPGFLALIDDVAGHDVSVHADADGGGRESFTELVSH